MLVCYLDDSGESAEPVITLAGLLSTAESWQQFEMDARVLFDSVGLEYLHTVDLHHRRCAFKGWNSTETAAFANALFRLVEAHGGFGVEFSVLKARYEERKKALGLKLGVSAMGMCFRGVVDRIVKDEGFLEAEQMPGVDLSFVVESGHANNNDILARFDAIKEMDPKRFGSLVFEDKKKTIALQVADFVAFYSRRIRNATQASPRTAEYENFIRTLGGIKHRPFLATDFGV
ncbi:DUF3800 domain-containing protein [Mesorhizobium sp. AR02]|uniref:DUF3800 domain-containing protein n=1 Tax=Mesorhizobium sp. AR02 TaxID=2865837 RepID=UPI0021601CFC|nr:DUF3800 domain-containing protein [Mesorhizobium sp. AR02]UVK56060.1 DUF3800 domain-containing protein [Mesorhizobium sp. AR02]